MSILVFVFLKSVIFCVHPDRIFCGTNFFIFQECVASEEILWCSLLLHLSILLT